MNECILLLDAPLPTPGIARSPFADNPGTGKHATRSDAPTSAKETATEPATVTDARVLLLTGYNCSRELSVGQYYTTHTNFSRPIRVRSTWQRNAGGWYAASLERATRPSLRANASATERSRQRLCVPAYLAYLPIPRPAAAPPRDRVATAVADGGWALGR